MGPLTLLKFLALNMCLIDAKLFPNHNYNNFGIRNRLARMNLDSLQNEWLAQRQKQLVEYVKNENDYPPMVISSGNIIGPVHPKLIKHFKNSDKSDILGSGPKRINFKRFENFEKPQDSEFSESNIRNTKFPNFMTQSQNSSTEIPLNGQFSESDIRNLGSIHPNFIESLQNSTLGKHLEEQLSENNIKNIGPNCTKGSQNSSLDRPESQFSENSRNIGTNWTKSSQNSSSERPLENQFSESNIRSIGPVHPNFIKKSKNSSLDRPIESQFSENNTRYNEPNWTKNSPNSSLDRPLETQFSENIKNIGPNWIKSSQNSSSERPLENQFSESNIRNIGPVHPNFIEKSKNSSLEKPSNNELINGRINGPYHPDFIKYLTNSSNEKPILDSPSSGSDVHIYSNSENHADSYYEYIKPQPPRVKIHVFRGPNTKYTVLGKHGEKEKSYSHWGYYISQPAENHPHILNL